MTAQQKKIARKLQRMQLKPGYILILEFSALGGIHYEREDIREDLVDKGLEKEFKTVKKVDNVELVKQGRAIINASYNTLHKYATQTPLGYFVDEASLRQLREDLAPIQESADIFNELAAQQYSERRVRIAMYPLPLDLANKDVAQRIAETITERLTQLRDYLRAGDRENFEAAWKRCTHLEHLATGIQGDSIRMALNCAKEQKKVMLEKLRSGAAGEEAGRDLDLEAIEAAISLSAPEGFDGVSVVDEDASAVA